jgi:hypothetical protein
MKSRGAVPDLPGPYRGLTELQSRRHLCLGDGDHSPLLLLPKGLGDNTHQNVERF